MLLGEAAGQKLVSSCVPCLVEEAAVQREERPICPAVQERFVPQVLLPQVPFEPSSMRLIAEMVLTLPHLIPHV